MECLVIQAEREGYSKTQIHRTMTVGELIAVLSDYDEDLPIYLSHDSGYTFGGILEDRIDVDEIEEEEE